MPTDKKLPVILVLSVVVLLASLLMSSANGAAIDNHHNTEEMMVPSERKLLPCYASCKYDNDCESGHCILDSDGGMMGDYCGQC